MIANDNFSSYYKDFIDGTYDCVDRIVLNAYYPLGQSGGGFRTWWRNFMDDDKLDNAHLIRFAARFSRRLHTMAEKNNIPLIHCRTGERKHEIAEKYIPTESSSRGVFCILAGRAPAPVYEVKKFANDSIDIRRKIPYPYVNHYSFHIMDDEWGHITIKLCPHPPFTAQIILNGHEYVEKQARKKQIDFGKEGNCFTTVSNAPELAKIADTMRAECSGGRLIQVCERWIYSACLCYALDSGEQERSGFRYRYSVYQAEYSRNLLFSRGKVLDQVFNGTIDRTRSLLDIKTVRTIFGYKNRPHIKVKKSKQPRFEVAVERPVYDLTVFKIHHGRMTVKMYSKGERVLRIEAVTHNTKDLRCGKVIEKFHDITESLKLILERFLSVLHAVDVSFIDSGVLEDWPRPAQLGNSRIAGINVNCQRMRIVMEAVMALSIKINNFTASELTEKVKQLYGSVEFPYSSRQAAYDLKKLRAKGLVRLPKRSHRYEATQEGLKKITAFIVLREKVLLPLLANACKRTHGKQPSNICQIDQYYENIQVEMRSIFQHFKIAA